METFLKFNNIKITHYYLDNQESNSKDLYTVVGSRSTVVLYCSRISAVVRISTEEVVTHCNLLLAIEEWNRKETIEY